MIISPFAFSGGRLHSNIGSDFSISFPVSYPSKLLSMFEESACARLTKLRIEIINTDIFVDALLMDLECITIQGE